MPLRPDGCHPEGTVRRPARHRAEREKLQQLEPPPQLDLFG